MGLIRLALACCVVFSHLSAVTEVVVFYRPLNSQLAVQCFFIISGFFVALVLNDKYTSIQLFYSNRALRLYPIYLVVLALAALGLFAFGVNLFIDRAAYVETTSNSAWLILVAVVTNLTLLGQDVLCWFYFGEDQWKLNTDFAKAPPGYIEGWHYLLVPQAWSLSFEIMFSALAPFLARRSSPMLIGIVLVSIAIRWAGDLTSITYHLWPRRLFPAELCLFIVGMLAYRFRGLAEGQDRRISIAMTAAVMLLIATHSYLPIAPMLGRTLMYAAIAISLPYVFAASRPSRIDRWIGDSSYPLYIGHVFAISVALALWPGKPAIAFVAALALAIALLILFDRPFAQWRRRRLQSQRAKNVGGFGKALSHDKAPVTQAAA